MTEFNPNCGKCGMLNSRGFCSLTACRYPSNVIVSVTKAIRGMMVNPQIEKPMTNYDRIVHMTPEELAIEETAKGGCPHDCETPDDLDTDCVRCWLDWLKSPVEVDNG